MPDNGRIRRGLSARELRVYRARGLLVLAEGATPTAADLRRARRIRRLRRDLGLSYEAIEVVLRLVDRLEAAERGGGAAERGAGSRITVLGR
jgi:DNA-binding transcriptional MerR regulator